MTREQAEKFAVGYPVLQIDHCFVRWIQWLIYGRRQA